ncbi:MAG: BREX-1 system phosphatase PglZ type A [Oscillospiraceae bacterium]|nr:BREX-1 system phosphatase PglZ type A [Oscillospiraceae bacterium]
MDSEKIMQDLNRRFAAPLPEFYKRRIVVWIDEDQEFVDKLDEITVNGAKVVALTGTNNFYVKKLLAVDDPTSNYLVYRPFAYESDEDNWLLDVELYGEEFRADLVSMWMDEMGIPQTTALRRGFKKYRKFFNAQARRNKVSAQSVTPATPARLQMAIMAALAGLKDAKPNAIIKAVLQGGLPKESNAVYQEFVTYGIDEAFWRMVAQGTGYQDMDPDLAQLATHILLTASTRTMRQEFLTGLQMFISSAHQAYCYDFVSDWMQSDYAGDIYVIAENVESELKLPQRFLKLQVADLIDTEVFPCVNEVILVKLMTEIRDHIIDVDTINQTVEKRRTCVWYEDVKYYYEGILQVAKMQAFFKEHSAGFHTVEPAKVWKEYTSEYYIMDTYYREFHKVYSDSLKNYHEELSDLFTHVMEKIEGLYSTWFLSQLGNNWSDACSDNLREYGQVLEVPQQTDFYRRQVAASDSKVYVIISDAMRYEVGASLAEQLQRETQAEVKLKSMQGVFPTITKFGMAALLPHKKLSIELKKGKTERLAVLADGQSTEANNRDKLLKIADSASVALKYKDIIGMKRANRQALIKGMNVVYIYHDTIDEAGHLESSIFSACDSAIEELKNMVRIITNEWGGANIIITSDHGFLYTHSPLTEDDKVDKTTETDQDVEIGRRYAIMQKGAQPQYLLPVKFLGGDTAYDAFTPRESIRIKMKGGGLNFVHGGISLQEMVVPVIEYHFLRNQNKEYKRNKSKYDTKPVEISLLSANRKISNMIFSLNFYQKEPVGGNREAAIYMLYFTDSTGKTISDVQKIIADKTSENGQDRTFRCSFNLKSLKYSNTETYYLIIADENGLQTQHEEFQIDIAFAVDEFDFF